MNLIRFNARIIALAALSVMFTLGALSNASAQMMPELRSNILVTGDFVKLGDLFRNAGPAAETPVFRSPAPGSSGVVSAKRLAQAARSLDVIWENPHRVSQIQIIRDGALISETEIKDLITDHLRDQVGAGAADHSFEIRFTSNQSPLFVSSDKDPSAEILELRYNRRSGRFTALVTAPAGDPAATQITYTGRAIQVSAVPILTRTMRRGSIISEHDIVVRNIPVSRIDSTTLLDAKDLIGMAARRTLKPGRPVSQGDIQEPTLVRKNTIVTVIYQSPGLSLTVQATAMQSGTMGDIINIRNRQSNRTIQATVIGPDQVAAQNRGTRLIAASN